MAKVHPSQFDSNTTFKIDNYTATHIIIKSPELVYVSTTKPTITIKWSYQIDSIVSFYEIGSIASLKTNRSIEVGLIYLDPFNMYHLVRTTVRPCSSKNVK